MREMMGMPSEVMQELMGTTANERPSASGSTRAADRVEELDETSSEDDEEMQSIMKRMEAELNETGVLNLDPTPRKIGATEVGYQGES